MIDIIEYANRCPRNVDFIEQCYYPTQRKVLFFYWKLSVPSTGTTVAIWRIKNIKGSNLSTGLASLGKP
jgi:hypothetical protein